MKRWVLYCVLTALFAMVALLSTIVNPTKAPKASASESVRKNNSAASGELLPKGRPEKPTAAQMKAYEDRIKAEDIKRERKLYLEAMKNGTKFEQDGTPYPVPTTTYMGGDWSHKRQPGEAG